MKKVTKKIISLTLVLCLLLSAFPVLNILASEFLLGDVNGDGNINVVDATLVQKYIASIEELDKDALKRAEVSGDGDISVVDATLIQKYAADLIDKFPADKEEDEISVSFNITISEETAASLNEDDRIAIAGTINSWGTAIDLSNDDWMLTKVDNTNYTLQLNFDESQIGETLEFKFVRITSDMEKFAWTYVEGDENYGEIVNRKYVIAESDNVYDGAILTFKDTGAGSLTSGTLDIVELDMPQYEDGRKRNIRVWMPEGYDAEDTDKKYPVLYMHDGQNLFDKSTSFAGEWGMEESIDALMKDKGYDGVIVVGIDNDGAFRTTEYLPEAFTGDSRHTNELYSKFIVETVKPYVDENYNTLTDRANTGIGGSSYGSIATIYPVLAYKEVFGMGLCFSSSAQIFTDNRLEEFVEAQVKGVAAEDLPKLYVYAGDSEGAGTKAFPELFKNILLENGLPEEKIETFIGIGFGHDEHAWSTHFSDAFEWLFMTGEEPEPEPETVTISFNVTLTEKAASAIKEDDRIAIAGNMNGWGGGIDLTGNDWMLTKVDDTNYTLEFDLGIANIGKPLQYKFVRIPSDMEKFAWTFVEGDEDGLEIPNRVHTIEESDNNIDATVFVFRDTTEEPSGGISAGTLDIVELDMPQYEDGRKRNIRVWMPEGYDAEDTDKKYPVLYMHDGQNLFDKSTSFAGEWGMEESIDALMKDKGYDGVIVVGIDNDGAFRTTEYLPEAFTGDSRHTNELYSKFIVETVKPYVDENYNTLTDRANTGIGGSSYGSIATIYPVLAYKEVFGMGLCFSSSAQIFTDNRLEEFVEAQVKGVAAEDLPKLYVYAGDSEGAGTKAFPELFKNILLENGLPEEKIETFIGIGFGHDEHAWSTHFSDAFEWLFMTGEEPEPEPEPEEVKLTLYWTPKDEWISESNVLNLNYGYGTDENNIKYVLPMKEMIHVGETSEGKQVYSVTLNVPDITAYKLQFQVRTTSGGWVGQHVGFSEVFTDLKDFNGKLFNGTDWVEADFTLADPVFKVRVTAPAEQMLEGDRIAIAHALNAWGGQVDTETGAWLLTQVEDTNIYEYEFTLDAKYANKTIMYKFARIPVDMVDFSYKYEDVENANRPHFILPGDNNLIEVTVNGFKNS